MLHRVPAGAIASPAGWPVPSGPTSALVRTVAVSVGRAVTVTAADAQAFQAAHARRRCGLPRPEVQIGGRPWRGAPIASAGVGVIPVATVRTARVSCPVRWIVVRWVVGRWVVGRWVVVRSVVGRSVAVRACRFAEFRFGNVRHGLIWFDQRWLAASRLAARWFAERRLDIPPTFKLDVLNLVAGHEAGAWFAGRSREP